MRSAAYEDPLEGRMYVGDVELGLPPEKRRRKQRRFSWVSFICDAALLALLLLVGWLLLGALPQVVPEELMKFRV